MDKKEDTQAVTAPLGSNAGLGGKSSYLPLPLPLPTGLQLGL